MDVVYCFTFQEEFEDSDEEGSEPSSKRRRTGDEVNRTAGKSIALQGHLRGGILFKLHVSAKSSASPKKK